MLRALDGKRAAGEIAAELSERFEVEISPGGHGALRRQGARADAARDHVVRRRRCRRRARRCGGRCARRATGCARRRRRAEPDDAGAAAGARIGRGALLALALRELERGHPRAGASYLAGSRARAGQRAGAPAVRAGPGARSSARPARPRTSRRSCCSTRRAGWRGSAARSAGSVRVAGRARDARVLLRRPVRVQRRSRSRASSWARSTSRSSATNMIVASFFHELGHGLACQHYGGNVTEIGSHALLLTSSRRPTATRAAAT